MIKPPGRVDKFDGYESATADADLNVCHQLLKRDGMVTFCTRTRLPLRAHANRSGDKESITAPIDRDAVCQGKNKNHCLPFSSFSRTQHKSRFPLYRRVSSAAFPFINWCTYIQKKKTKNKNAVDVQKVPPFLLQLMRRMEELWCG